MVSGFHRVLGGGIPKGVSRLPEISGHTHALGFRPCAVEGLKIFAMTWLVL